ncbi:MAG TPA: ABC transporter permease, partial [Sediminibacterium sp.]|nr:ABC transporter permease [Sediminibacterium sp.]
MFRTNLKFAIRNLRNHQRHALLNIAGLSVAIAACLVIYLVVDHEYSFDTYHQHAKQVFQIVKKETTPDGDAYSVATPLPMTAALRADFPGVIFSELFNSYGSQVTVMSDARKDSDKKFVEKTGVFYADPALFECFDVNWLAGNRSVLTNNNVAVLSRSVADKYFGTWQEAMGKFIKIDNTVTAQVAGIIGDPPANTDFPFAVVVSYRSFDTHLAELGFAGMKDQWGAATSNHQVYALLPESVSATAIDQGFRNFVPKYLRPHLNKSQQVQIFLQPLRNIHFDTRFNNNGTHISSKTSLNTLAFIGLLILLMACINFVNLSTALSVKRSKEVGIRKVMGSSSGQLAGQVFWETFLLVCLSAIVALGLAYFSLPYLKYLVQIENRLPLFRPWNMVFLALVIALTTLLSAIYPAMVLSRFQPIEAMRNKVNTSKLGSLSLRRVLVVIQFCFSQILIIATIIALRQMYYVQNADLGFNKASIVLLHGNNDSASIARLDAFKKSLLAIPGVQDVSCSFDPPSSGN